MALGSQLNLLNLLLALVSPVPHPLELYRLSRVPGTETASSLDTRLPTPQSTVWLPPALHNHRIILVTELSRPWPLRRPVTAALGASRQTRLRGVTPPPLFNKTKPAEWGEEYSPRYRRCRRGGFYFLLSYDVPHSCGHSTCWSNGERGQNHGWTRRAYRAATQTFLLDDWEDQRLQPWTIPWVRAVPVSQGLWERGHQAVAVSATAALQALIFSNQCRACRCKDLC